MLFCLFVHIANLKYILVVICGGTLADQVNALQQSLPYSPPDLNKNITEIFGKLINIYRGET